MNSAPDHITPSVFHDFDEMGKTGAGCDWDERIRPPRLAQRSRSDWQGDLPRAPSIGLDDDAQRWQGICAGIAANEGRHERVRITDFPPIGTTRRVCRSRVVSA